MPFMTQRWEDLIFLHWHWPKDEIKKSLPIELEVDLFEDTGWLTVAAFKLSGLRISPCRFIRWSDFYEINLRTYVRDKNGRSGVWFYSLDSSDIVATIGARFLYGLPYNGAKIVRNEKDGARFLYGLPYNGAKIVRNEKDGEVEYQSTRRGIFGEAKATIKRPAIDPLPKDATDPITRFLLERYCFWSKQYWARQNKPSFVEHRPYQGRIMGQCTYSGELFKSQGFAEPTRKPDISHYESGFDVSASAPTWLRGRITGQENQRLVD